MRIAATIVAVVLATIGAPQAPVTLGDPLQAPLPDREQFMARVRAAIRIDTDVQQDFVYLERRRDVQFSVLGKVSVGPPRTFEVFPSSDPARTYKRLVESDGQRLDPVEMARRDAERARELEEQTRRESRESPEQRSRRLERAEADRRDRMAMLTDALAVFEAAVVGRETIEGEPAIVVTLTPRRDARV
ncbi:MAG: hypothetical protein ABIX28_24265, partial [Vicinamibacterales bacterium]